jgi:hypothetical protein
MAPWSVRLVGRASRRQRAEAEREGAAGCVAARPGPVGPT